MKKLLFISCLFPFVSAAFGTEEIDRTYVDFNSELKASETPCRDRVCLNGIWDFFPMAEKGLFDKFPTETWQKIRVPSYWNFPSLYEFPMEWDKVHKAWYKRTVSIPAAWKGKRVFIHLGGVCYWCRLHVNGQAVATPETVGFLPIDVDITDRISYGKENSLALAVQDSTYYGVKSEGVESTQPLRGVWQDVYLYVVPEVFTNNQVIRTSVREHAIDVVSRFWNKTAQPREISVTHRVTELDGKQVMDLPGKTVNVPAHSVAEASSRAVWPDPRLWSFDHPHLYYLETLLKDGERVLDKKITRFGFREFWIEGDKFILNGEKVTLKGCWDNPVDNIYPEQLNRKYAEVNFRALKEMNLNTIRWHACRGLPIPVFYELADEMGFLAIAGLDSPSNGLLPKATAREGGILNFKRGIYRDRNHPSIVIWNANNEQFSFIYWQGTLRSGPPEFEQVEAFETLKGLGNAIKETDPTRPVTYHGCYDLFGFASNINVHYPVYVIDLPSGRKFFRNLRKDYPEIFKRNKPILVGEFWFVPQEREFFEKYCGEEAFADPWSGFRANAEYDEELILGWRRDKIAGMLGFFNYTPLWHPFKASVNGPVKIKYESFEGPYMKTTFTLRPRVNPGWDPTSGPYSPSPVFVAVKRAFAPLVAYMPEHGLNYLAGQEIEKEIVVINDYPKERDYTLQAAFLQNGVEKTKIRLKVKVPKTDVTQFKLKVQVPEVSRKEVFTLRVALLDQEKEAATTDYAVTVFPAEYIKPPVITGTFQVYDKKGLTTAILKKAGMKFISVSDLSSLDTSLPLILGYRSQDEKAVEARSEIQEFMKKGGRCLFFEQKDQGGSDCEAYIQASGHPVFEGIDGPKLSLWQGEENYVTDGAFPKPEKGNFRILADCDVKRTPLLETFEGKGLLLRCQFRCTLRYGKDPVATKLVHNLLNYIARPGEKLEFRSVYFVKGSGETQKAFDTLGVRYTHWNMKDILPKNSTLVLGSRALQSTPQVVSQKQTMDRFVNDGGQLIIFPQNDLGPLFGNQIPLLDVGYTEGRHDRFFRESDGPAAWGIDPLDFLPWTDWAGMVLAGSWPKEWTPVIDFRKGFTAYSYPSHYSPGSPGPHECFRAEQDEAFARQYKVLGGAVLEKKQGKGRILLIQLACDREIEKSSEAKRILSLLLTNAGVPMQDLQASAQGSINDYQFVDLAPYATNGFTYTSQTGGWTDEGPINDAREFPVGRGFFAGVPFNVIDPEKNDGRSCIILSSQKIPSNSLHRKRYPERVERIKIGQKAKTLYFLQATGWGYHDVELASYRIHYADGGTVKIPMISDVNVADWWLPKEIPQAKIGWVGKNASCSTVGVYVFGWDNPRPGVLVESVDFVSENKTPIPILIGITALKMEATARIGPNEKFTFRGYTFKPTRIEALGTFTAQLSIFKDKAVVAEGFGIRKDQTRSISKDGQKITVTLLSLSEGKGEFRIQIE